MFFVFLLILKKYISHIFLYCCAIKTTNKPTCISSPAPGSSWRLLCRSSEEVADLILLIMSTSTGGGCFLRSGLNMAGLDQPHPGGR